MTRSEAAGGTVRVDPLTDPPTDPPTDHRDDTSPLVVAKDPVRLRSLLGLAVAGGVAGLAHLAWGRVGGRGGHVLAGAVVVTSGAGLGRLASTSGWTHPALVLTADALHDHASGAAVGELPWNQVTGWRVRHLPGSDVLQLKVRDERALLRDLRPLARVVAEVNRRRLGAPVNLPLAACALGPAVLRTEVETRVRAAEDTREAASLSGPGDRHAGAMHG